MFVSASQPAKFSGSRASWRSEEFETVQSWGRTHKAAQDCRRPSFLDGATAELTRQCSLFTLAYGCGRSYGDVCLNSGGRLLMTRRLNRLIYADWERGVVRAESGITLDDLLHLTIPRRWFPYATTVTNFVKLVGL